MSIKSNNCVPLHYKVRIVGISPTIVACFFVIPFNCNAMSDTIRSQLLAYAQCYETADFLVGDPSSFMHRVSGEQNRELMAWIASAFSYGRREQFMAKIEYILNLTGGNVYQWVVDGCFLQAFHEGDTSCFYRLYTHADVSVFLSATRQLLLTYGSLKSFVCASSLRPVTAHSAVEALCRYYARYQCKMIPKDATSPCKRVCMFLRWMVRSDSPVDLGLWRDMIDPATLIIPLDTHVMQQAHRLGLLQKVTASMRTAVHLTERLADIFPGDPVKGDFALFGYGVNNK